MSLDTLFNPRSVAVIGATAQTQKVGYALTKNIVEGSPRDVYPVTLGEGEILGRQTYRSVLEVPDDVDLAVIAVRANFCASILQECAQKNIHNAIIISAGFKETGSEGRTLEEDLRQIADDYGIALLGPNCLGIIDAHHDFNATFGVHKPLPGGISFLSQSGALGTALLDYANQESIGFSKFVSLGNEAVLSELEFLEYLAGDESTSSILMYLEKVTDGARFLEALQIVTDKKPVVILRAGRSQRGSAAVMSHTGSLAPSDAVFEAACKQGGAITVRSLQELYDITKLLHMGITRSFRNLAVVTNGGGPSVNTADLIDLSASLTLAEFPEETKAALRDVLPSMAAVGNPIDLIGDASPQRFDDALRILESRDDIDATLAIVTPQMMTDSEAIARTILTHCDKKPIIPAFMGGRAMERGVSILAENGLINFDLPTNAVQALDLLARDTPKQKPQQSHVITTKNTSLSMLPIDAMQRMLGAYGLLLDGVFVHDKDGIKGALDHLGIGPYVVKAISQQLVHKSDLHAVKLDLVERSDVEYAWNEIVRDVHISVPNAKIDGMLIQAMHIGREVIIGMKRDPVFGPVILFGLGGIFVEVLKDISMRIAPISKEEALVQMKAIRGYPLLAGVRGETSVHLAALADIIVSLSTLALEHPEIEEIDLNPVIATQDTAAIVDARLMIR